jgi:hypothetical protein
MNLALWAAFEALALPPPSHDPAVEVARMVDVSGEDHGAARPAKGIYEAFHRRKDRHTTTRERRGCRVEEEPLHVDHEQSARRRVQSHLMLVVWTDLFQPRQSLGFDVLGRRIWFHDYSLDCASVRITGWPPGRLRQLENVSPLFPVASMPWLYEFSSSYYYISRLHLDPDLNNL